MTETFISFRHKTFQLKIGSILLTVWKATRWRVALHVGTRYYHN